MAPNPLPSPPTNKRKRESIDHDHGGRPLKSPNNTNGDTGNLTNDEELNLQLLQGIQEHDENTRTAQAALASATPSHQSTYPPPEHSFDSGTGLPHGLSSFDDSSNSPPTGGFSAITPTAQALMAAREATTPINHNKPAVGTPQWHQQRKDNHKEGKPFPGSDWKWLVRITS